MKALVIDDSPNKIGENPPFKKGEEVNISPCDCGNSRCDHVLVKEYPPLSYGGNRFAPTSSKDETEYADKIMDKIFVPVEKQ